ncbi:RNA polymerase sigma factor [Candidatus Uhrbacteria bacterium]|nr:RNA polymerase sigma factor [Candidatus Uhrbacteria bacterium]
MKEQFLFFKIRNWADTESFGKLYDLYVQKIYRFVYFKVGSQEDAQDITSQTFLKVWQHLTTENSDKVRNVNAFIYQVARNSVIDYFRAKGVEQEWQENFEVAEEQPAQDNTQDMVQKNLDKEMILGGIKKLKPGQQEVIMMRYVEDMDLNDIALIINKSNGATRVIIHRALQELKKILNEPK